MTAPAVATVMSGGSGPDVVRLRDEWVSRLRGLGLRVTADPRNVQPPCVLVQRPSLVPFGRFCEGLRIEWVLHLVVRGPDNSVMWDQLEWMRRTVWPLLSNTITGCDAETFDLNDTTEAPSYRIQFEQVV